MITFSWPGDAIAIAAVVVGALVLRAVLRRAIRAAVNQSIAASERKEATLKRKQGDQPLADSRHGARVRTIGSIMTNATDIVLVLVVVLTVFRVLGVPLEPVLAASGIGGVALAFGAQSLVKDYVTGMFMIFEDQFGVGDLIDTGEAVGTVEEIGLRVTRLRDANGQIWYIRNGEIKRIGNQSQGWSTGVVDVPFASSVDPATALKVIDGVVDEVYDDEKYADVLLDRPSVAGVNSVVGGTTTVRIFAKTRPNQQWALQRDLLARCVAALQRAGVPGPMVAPLRTGPDA